MQAESGAVSADANGTTKICQDDGHALSTVSAVLEGYLRQNLSVQKKNQKYWYPLSVPTYGVEEVMNVLDSLLTFQTTMGPKVAQFEERFAKWLNVKHAVMVNSGSSADLLACFALVTPSYRRLQPGDEVLIPALTWPTHIWSAVMAGFKVRTVDVDLQTLNVTPAILESEISDQTKAVFLVHLMGSPCDMASIVQICQRHDLLLLEDCCESLDATFDGRRVGTFGIAGTYSFFFSHHLVTMEGGMVVTDDDDFADCLRMLRAHGWSRNVRQPKVALPANIDRRFLFLDWGFNVRPMEVQGAFGQVQLRRQEAYRKSRLEKFQLLRMALEPYEEIALPEVAPGGSPSWMFVPLIVKPNLRFTKSDLVSFLETVGVETRPVIVGDFSQQPAADLYPFLTAKQHAGVRFIHDNAFTIGLHPVVDLVTDSQCQRSDDVERLVQEFHKFFTTLRSPPSDKIP